MNDQAQTEKPGQFGSTRTTEGRTDRALRRAQEDDRYVPVIVKRTDEARRHPDDILEVAIEEGLEQLRRRPVSLALSSLAAGLILGFTAMSVGVTTMALQDFDFPFLVRIAVALVYPMGFVVCIMSGTELFTEHTATAVYPVLEGKARVSAMVRLWIIVLAGNLVGALASAVLLALADDVVGAATGYVEVASHLVRFNSLPLLISALLAGWLMALGAWLILATPPTVSQLASIYVVTFLIGIGGLHHSIAGSAEVLAAYLTSVEFTVGEVLRFISLAAAGNLIGGSLFVAVLNYGHIRKSRKI